MTIFHTICYGETEPVYEFDIESGKDIRRLGLSESARREAISIARKLKKQVTKNEQIVIVSSPARPAVECAEVVTKVLNCQSMKLKSLSYPNIKIGLIIESLLALPKAWPGLSVCIVVTNTDNDGSIKTRLATSHGKRIDFEPLVDVESEDFLEEGDDLLVSVDVSAEEEPLEEEDLDD